MVIHFLRAKNHMSILNLPTPSESVPWVSKYRVRGSNPFKTQALPATGDITLDYSPVHLGRTPRKFCHYSSIASRTCVLLELNFIIDCCAQHLLGGYLLLLAIPTSLVHCAFTSSTCSSINTQLYYSCNMYNYLFNTFILINLTIDF
jgi:hypothetical protein